MLLRSALIAALLVLLPASAGAESVRVACAISLKEAKIGRAHV